MGAQWKQINDNYKNLEGYKRVAWPPTSEERVVREFTPQPQNQYPPGPVYNPQQQQQQQQQPSAAAPSSQYRAPSFDNYQQPYQQQPQYIQGPQPFYQTQAPPTQYQPPPKPVSQYQQYPHQQYQPQPAWSQPQQQQQQQQYQQPPWAQQPQQYQQSTQPQYQTPSNQYNQAPYHQQQQQQYKPQQNQFVPQSNQQQFNSYSQPQQQQRTVSHDQVDQKPYLPQDQRGASPGIITLRKEAPITQKPAPVFTSQPAAVSFGGGSNMRGDLKWPPPEYKEAAAKENEERRKLALGPVCRPRKVHRDYTSFFAKNALSHHYPSYKVPPGTQHMTC